MNNMINNLPKSLVEAATKILIESHDEHIFYHGSPKPEEIEKHGFQIQGTGGGRNSSGPFGDGIYLTPHKALADSYRRGGATFTVKGDNLKLKKMGIKEWQSDMTSKEFKDWHDSELNKNAQETSYSLMSKWYHNKGYDGIHIAIGNGLDQAIVYTPEKLKIIGKETADTLPKSVIETVKELLKTPLFEMAIPSKEVKSQVFYHGTYQNNSDGLEKASKIADKGIVPPYLSGKKENNLTPVHGMAYSTPHLGYAQMYAIGGDVAGSSYKPSHSHGYVFAFKGKNLSDIQPDEDSVGELYYKHHSSFYKNFKAPDYIDELATKHASYHTRKKAKEGEYEYFAKLGKSILPHMTDEQKIDLIHNHGVHVANKGTIEPDRVYRINTEKIPLLKKDASNFFDHAEELDMDELKKGNVVVRRKRKPL